MSPLRTDWNNIDTVLLDMDGTLLDLHFDNFFWLHHLPKRYSEQHGIDATVARLDLQQRMASRQGTLDWYCTGITLVLHSGTVLYWYCTGTALVLYWYCTGFVLILRWY